LSSTLDVSFEVLDLASPNKTCTSPPNFPRVGQRAIAGKLLEAKNFGASLYKSQMIG